MASSPKNPDALASLYGKGAVAATRTRECVAMPGLREQTVFTPWPIVIVLLALWGRVTYDPCHGHPGVVLTGPGRKLGKLDELLAKGWTHETLVAEGHAVATASLIPATYWTDSRGLIDLWLDETFCNPPYGTLKDWLEWAMAQFVDHILLVPVRPNRTWWRKWAASIPAGDLVYLNPLKFVGYEQAFPAPLCLARANAPAAERGRLGHLCKALRLGSTIENETIIMPEPLEEIRGLAHLHQLESDLLVLGARLAEWGYIDPQPDAVQVLRALAKALNVELPPLQD